MILDFPDHFDLNEWFILAALLGNILIFLFLSKRIPKAITPLIVLLSISFPKVMDHTMGVPPFDLYDVNDSKSYELFDLLSYGVYPAFGYLFVYFIEVLKLKKWKLILYIVLWSWFGLLVEYITIQLHVFTYTGWRLIYSLPIYLVTLISTYIFYETIMKINRKAPPVQ